jgi:hypothetical protein
LCVLWVVRKDIDCVFSEWSGWNCLKSISSGGRRLGNVDLG